ncbi:MAG: hypothetical protein K2M48_01315, partial [Clostridiales bacterium]|nr:hypothetical protein [Clostridiales bacterium]
RLFGRKAVEPERREYAARRLRRVKLGEDLAEIGSLAFSECNIYEDDPTLFIELTGDAAPTMGEKITIGNISVHIQVKDIDVALACFNDGTWSAYCRHLYIESGDEAGKYMCGADLLELDGRAVYQSSYLLLYEILNENEIVFYQYEAPTQYDIISGEIVNGVIKVTFAGVKHEFEKITGEKTYTTEDGKYTLVCDPFDLLPDNYEGYVGYASATLNGKAVSIYVSGYGTKLIKGFVDSDGKTYDINLSFDCNRLVVKKTAAETYVRDITAADGSVINLHYKGSLVYVYGEIKIEVANGKYLVFGDLGTIALDFEDNSFWFRYNYGGTIYTVNVTLSDDMTTFIYTYTSQPQ